jgi:bifunctional enzyme CysN/CysC
VAAGGRIDRDHAWRRGRVQKTRDPKGLCSRAKAGKIKNFAGIDAPYEAPHKPEIHLKTVGQQPEQLANHVLDKLAGLGLI